MEQNNFEKNMQHKLDELKIPPSDSVWTNVEKRIGKKDKDRRFIFILFFILVLLSGAFWLLNSSKNNQNKSKNNQNKNLQISNVIKTKKISKATNKQDSSFKKTKKITGTNQGNSYSESIAANKIKKFKADSQNGNKKEKVKKQRNLIDLLKLKTNNSNKETYKEDSEIPLNSENKLIEKETLIAEIENKNESENVERNIQNQISNDSLSKELKSQKTTEKLIAKKASSIKKTDKNHQWILGITLSGGTSLIGNNTLERNYPLADMNAGAPQGGGPSYYPPSTIKNSAAFMAGILIEKNLSLKAKISLGLSYKYYSLLNKVGNKIDSAFAPWQYFSLNNFYNSANPIHSYRNNFHYLEVPASIKIQLNKNDNLQLFWNAGINISQLISTNALQFTSSPGYYYKDNSIFNKIQFGLNTGFSATFFAKGNRPFNIGPYFYYTATKLANKGLYDKTHFTFIGLRTEILFQKK